MVKQKKLVAVILVFAFLVITPISIYYFFSSRDNKLEKTFKSIKIGQDLEESSKKMQATGGKNTSNEASVKRFNSTISLRQFVIYGESGVVSGTEILQSFWLIAWMAPVLNGNNLSKFHFNSDLRYDAYPLKTDPIETPRQAGRVAIQKSSVCRNSRLVFPAFYRLFVAKAWRFGGLPSDATLWTLGSQALKAII